MASSRIMCFRRTLQAARQTHFFSGTQKFRTYSVGAAKFSQDSLETENEHSTAIKRYIGQPMPYTHSYLMKAGEITPGITHEEYRQRRSRFMSEIMRSTASDSHHVVILTSHPRMYMSDEIPYPFRQNTDFLYLSGFQEPDSVLILESDPSTLALHRSTLTVPERDQHNELWHGPRAGVEGAMGFIGVDRAEPAENLNGVLRTLRERENTVFWYEASKPCHPDLHAKVTRLLLEPLSHHGGGVAVRSPREILHSLRVVKSPAEVQLMRRSGSIAAKGFAEVMRASRPGVTEQELYALIDCHCRVKGAEFLAYVPVVAGGNRANTLHYINNNQVIEGGELVLMDAGCEYHGYASDITRTWPVSGKYTPPQRMVYEAVLRVQRECLAMCGSQYSLNEIHNAMIVLLGEELKGLGVAAPDMAGFELIKVAAKHCPHHVGHYLGMDVHDCSLFSRSSKLLPGMVITIEPGLYFPADDASIPEQFRGVGIRIEDDVLITNDTPVVLSSECPKEIDHIESIIGNYS